MRNEVQSRTKVIIRSLEWYQDNVNRYGIIECGKYEFFEPMNEYCGKVVTIKRIDVDNYRIDADKGAFCWTDEMIEGLVEENMNFDVVVKETTKDISDKVVDTLMGGLMVGKSFNLPQGYIFKDENGNVINATKIVLEKKKKEYPKTYEECAEIITEFTGSDCNLKGCIGYMDVELTALQKLLICRDAYWKIAGEEMGLGKPWEPTDSDYITGRYCIFVHRGNIICDTPAQDCILTFPTIEMRDTFKKNFDPDIELCKEFL